MDLLVSAQWLAEHLANPQLRVFDATVQVQIPTLRTVEPEWRQEHIPGSSFAEGRGPVS